MLHESWTTLFEKLFPRHALTSRRRNPRLEPIAIFRRWKILTSRTINTILLFFHLLPPYWCFEINRVGTRRSRGYPQSILAKYSYTYTCDSSSDITLILNNLFKKQLLICVINYIRTYKSWVKSTTMTLRLYWKYKWNKQTTGNKATRS